MRPETWLILFGTVSTTFFLVVCVIFMVITPLIPLPAFIDLPRATSASRSPEYEGDAIVSIRRTGETYLHTRQLEHPLLARELATTRRGTLRLRVDRDTPFAHVRAVVVAAQAAGYRQMTIMVQQDASTAEGTGISLTDCWDCGSDLLPAYLTVSLLFFAPVGAYVLRRQIASATGAARLAGRVLQAVALVSLPPAILLVLAILVMM